MTLEEAHRRLDAIADVAVDDEVAHSDEDTFRGAQHDALRGSPRFLLDVDDLVTDALEEALVGLEIGREDVAA